MTALDPTRTPARPDAEGPVHAGLTLRRYAEIAAHVRHFAPSTAEVLARLGVPKDDWEAADRAFAAAIEAEVARGEAVLVTRYAAAVRAVRARLAETTPALSDLVPSPPAAPEPAMPEPAPPAKPETAALASPAPAEPPPAEPPPARRRRAETVAVMEAPSPATALPFQPGAATAEPVAEPRPSPAPAPAPARAPLTGTADLDLQHILAAIPFASAAKKAPLPELTLEQYASLCAELAVAPHASVEILGRYGLSADGAGAALEAAWGQRFTRDPALYARWNELRHRYQSWLIHRGR